MHSFDKVDSSIVAPVTEPAWSHSQQWTAVPLLKEELVAKATSFLTGPARAAVSVTEKPIRTDFRSQRIVGSISNSHFKEEKL